MNIITRGLGPKQGLITRGFLSFIDAIKRVAHGAGGLLKKILNRASRADSIIDTNLIRVKKRKRLLLVVSLVEFKLSAKLITSKVSVTKKNRVEVLYGAV